MTERMLKRKIICICQLCTVLFCLLTEIFSLGTTNICVNNTSGLADYGKDCVSDTDCTTGYCINLLCSCPSDLYYDSCKVACVNRTSYGHDCNVTEQCIDGFICTGICDCSTGYFYDKATTTCSRSLIHGENCTSSFACLSSLNCATDRDSVYKCLCPTSTFDYLGLCFMDSELSVNLSNESFTTSDLIYLKWSRSSGRSDITYNVTWASPQPSLDSGYVSTKLNELYVTSLHPQTVYTFTIISILPDDMFYLNRSVQTIFTLKTKNEKEDTTKNGLIAAVTVGWVIAGAAIIALVVVFVRRRYNKASTTWIHPAEHLGNVPVVQQNDYKKESEKAPKKTKKDRKQKTDGAVDSEYINQQEISKASTSEHVNRTYQPDTETDYPDDEQTYELVDDL